MTEPGPALTVTLLFDSRPGAWGGRRDAFPASIATALSPVTVAALYDDSETLRAAIA
jgi:hypothetical protein